MIAKDLKDRPLLFVNSDPREGGTVPHRRAIYQHVQLKYAKWKRSEKAQQVRRSSDDRSQQDGDCLAKSPSNVSTFPTRKRTLLTFPQGTSPF